MTLSSDHFPSSGSTGRGGRLTAGDTGSRPSGARGDGAARRSAHPDGASGGWPVARHADGSRDGEAAAPAREGRPSGGESYPVRTEEDLLVVRHAVRSASVETGFGLVDQTRVVTAASELARNAYIHGGGGVLVIERLRRPGRQGLRLTVRDDGPGIADLDEAMRDGYTTGAGLGHGLGGAQRLMDDFDVDSSPEGTTVSVTRWTSP
ncbi:ATP-binding protein [Streptomyces sp. NPDC059740]|uniref:ATP-binding protein n=1 Tax=Streptomyces sp. NPDC059740 TaxID=3346926 RepID=UPI0036575E74